MLRVVAFLFLILCEHPTLKEIFQCISEVAERLIALLKEKSGASHGQKRRSTGQPRRVETVRSGTEKRGAVEVLALSALPFPPEVLSSCRTNTTCPKKRPVEGHSCWFTPVAVVCTVPMRRARLERPCRRQQGEWQSRGRKSTTRPMAGVHAGREFGAASKAGGNEMDKVRISRGSVNAMQVSRR